MDYNSNRSPRRIREEAEQERLLAAVDDALNAWPPSQDINKDRTPDPPVIQFRESQERRPSQTRRSESSTQPDTPRPKTPYPNLTANGVASSVRGNTTAKPSPQDATFHNSNTTEQWRCPRCKADEDLSSERVRDLDRNGQLVFRCKWASCNASLLAHKKLNGTVTIEEIKVEEMRKQSKLRRVKGWFKKLREKGRGWQSR